MSSGPLPPATKSSPERALTSSPPPKASMSSSTREPVIRSFCSVPVHGPPRHWMLAASATPPASNKAKIMVLKNSRVPLKNATSLQEGGVNSPA
jgi:hypothetical protein